MAAPATLSRVAISKILLATDFSPESHNALQCALSLSRRYGSKLFVAHAVQAEAVPLPDLMQNNAEQNMARLELTEELKSVPHQTIVKSGDPWEVLSAILADEHVDLIVMATHGRGGFNKLVLGSTAEQVIRHAPCPVLTVGPHVRLPNRDHMGSILYATDFSEGSMRALTYALSLAEQDCSELTMLYVIQAKPFSESELVTWKRHHRDKLKELVPRSVDLAHDPEIEVEVGDPGQEIVRLADNRNSNLVVMGCHAGGAFSTHLPWTTLHHVLHYVHCPVLTVRGT